MLGWPSSTLLPPDYLNQGSGKVLSNSKAYVPALGYGPGEGYPPLREEIGKWLTKFYNPRDAISHERICISGGASQNLACIMQTFTDPVYTRNIWMVAPAYYLSFRIIEDSGFAGKLKGVPEDDEGIDLVHLRKHMKESEARAQAQGNTEPVRECG